MLTAYRSNLLLLLLCLGLVSPLAAGDEDEDKGRIKHQAAAKAYYRISPDLRLCLFPLCGGYFVSQVNHELTRCADGTLQEACYVAEIDWSAIDLEGDEGARLVLGKLRKRNYPGFGPLGVLRPEVAWRPATDAPPEGTWYGLQDNGILCITFPCYNIDERVLNKTATQLVSGVDLSGVEADPADVEAAYLALHNDELIAVGMNQVIPDEGPAGDGLTMIASQFYLKLGEELAEALSCETVDDCTLTVYHSEVDSWGDCYCPLCPVPLNSESAQENEASWLETCDTFGFPGRGKGRGSELICPMVLCIAPPPLACVNHQCVFLETPLLLP
jgi:hypothetical protein